jgi:hypothetical protein
MDPLYAYLVSLREVRCQKVDATGIVIVTLHVVFKMPIISEWVTDVFLLT